jgi:hypothetical protein
LGDPLKGNLLLFYKPLHLEAQQVSTRIEVRRHHQPALCEEFEKFRLELVSHGFLANLEVRPTLFDQIKGIEGIKRRMGREEVPRFLID